MRFTILYPLTLGFTARTRVAGMEGTFDWQIGGPD
jgi:hypothetical protein